MSFASLDSLILPRIHVVGRSLVARRIPESSWCHSTAFDRIDNTHFACLPDRSVLGILTINLIRNRIVPDDNPPHPLLFPRLSPAIVDHRGRARGIQKSPRLGRRIAPRGVKIGSSTAPRGRDSSSLATQEKRFICQFDRGNVNFIRVNSVVASDAAAGSVVTRRAAKNATNRSAKNPNRDRSTRERPNSIHRPRSGGSSRGRRSVEHTNR